MRTLGIDLGQKRVGIAISDPLGHIASALETCLARDRDFLLAHIRKLCVDYQVNHLVFGLPLRTDGKASAKAEEYLAWAQEIAHKLNLPYSMEDERFTTVLAHQAMMEAGADSRKRRDSVDRVAAVIILQGYLDKQNKTSSQDPPEWGSEDPPEWN